MTDRDLDRDLMSRFDALRSADLTDAPAFEETWRRAQSAVKLETRRPTERAAAVVALAAGLAASVAAVGLLVPRTERARSIEESIAKAEEISSWSAPTDPFLDLASLDTSSGGAPGAASRSPR